MDEALHARDQLGLVERLDDEVVGAEKQPRDPIVRLRVGPGDEEDRHLVEALAPQV